MPSTQHTQLLHFFLTRIRGCSGLGLLFLPSLDSASRSLCRLLFAAGGLLPLPGGLLLDRYSQDVLDASAMSGGTSTPGSSCGSIVSSSGPESLSEGLEHSGTHTREKVYHRTQYRSSILYRFIITVCMYIYVHTLWNLKWGKLLYTAVAYYACEILESVLHVNTTFKCIHRKKGVSDN